MENFDDDRLSDSCAICLIGHGSRDPEGIEEFLSLWEKLRERNFCPTTQYGFLEFSKPTVAEALSACRNVENIIILPGILLPGAHTKKDIPNVVREALQGHPKINIIFARPLGAGTEIMKICRERIEEAEYSSNNEVSRSETLLLTIAHGSSDGDGNAQVEKSFDLLGKELGFAKSVTHFAGTSQDSPEDVLEKLMPEKFRRVILLPFFLLSGVWVKRVHRLAETFKEKHPNTEFLAASCLKHHKLVVDTLIQRAQESIAGPQI
jgi:precorrin-8X/cobalt-precorrin-8 methylmutase